MCLGQLYFQNGIARGQRSALLEDLDRLIDESLANELVGDTDIFPRSLVRLTLFAQELRVFVADLDVLSVDLGELLEYFSRTLFVALLGIELDKGLKVRFGLHKEAFFRLKLGEAAHGGFVV